jgi:hypothetical protein
MLGLDWYPDQQFSGSIPDAPKLQRSAPGTILYGDNYINVLDNLESQK